MDKFESILNAFTNGYNPSCTAYLELLTSHLQKKENTIILQSPYVTKWVLSCLEKLESDFSYFESNILAFIIKLSALLTSNEWLVVQLRDEKLLDRFHTLFTINQNELPHCVKLAHIRLLKAVSNYSLGVGWIRMMSPWKFLVNYCYKNHTIYVVRESKAVLFDILYKFSVKLPDEKMCIEIIGEILKPINENVFPNSMNIVIVDDNAIEEKIGPALDLISYIFEQTLECDEKTSIVHICEEVFQLELNIWKIAGMSTNPKFLEKVLRCLSTLNFARLVYEKWTIGKIADVDFNIFGVTFFNIMKFCVARRAYTNFLRMAEFNHILWKKLGSRAPDQIMIENERIEFENQLIMFHLLPVLFICKSSCEEEFLDKFMMKMFSISCEFTHRICYGFRDILFDCPEKVPDLAYKSIHEMLSMESILDKNRAVLIFQALCYALKEFVVTPHKDKENDEQPATKVHQMCTPNVLHAVLVGAQSLIEKYNISWKDSLETICITNFTQMIIDNPDVNSRLAVQAIKLTQVSIEHFLAPNMALLMDNLQGSGLQKVGPIIIRRFHDVEWEVRDSAIELISSIAEISHTKFPVFQNYLVEHGIPPLIYTISKNDSEAYVRESAFKCISQMVNIDLIWENSIKKLDLEKEILSAICKEDEGIVRKEIVNLLTVMYENGRLSTENPLLFSIMCECAVNDLYWEVKVQALRFWACEIRRHFTNQGMIDGTFPQVTFSKEKKKIVTLTDKEIVLRIDKIMSELSSCGCLAVLLHCLNDQCDTEVVKATVVLTKKLFNCFHKYDYIKKMSTTETMTPRPQTNVQMSVDESIDVDSFSRPAPIVDLKTIESVIDSITSTDDINLLAFNYQNHMNGEVSEGRIVDVNYYKEFAKISPLEFINKVKIIDIDKLVSIKDDWMKETESFNSLLDDILSGVSGFQANVDCY